jgi:hypothetical protein
MKTPTNKPADPNGPDGIFVELRDLPDETLWSILPEWDGEYPRDNADFDDAPQPIRHQAPTPAESSSGPAPSLAMNSVL